MNCILKVNDSDGLINRIHECTGEGWVRYYIDLKNKLDDHPFQAAAYSLEESYKYIALYHNGKRTTIEFRTEEECELVMNEGRYEITAILIAHRLIEKQEEVYPNVT